MNALSRKLRELESNVLEFPPKEEDIVLHIGNTDEQLLHDRAQKIREAFKAEAQAIIDSDMSPEQQNEAAQQVLNKLTENEQAVLDRSYEFLIYRLQHLVYKWFSSAYPKGADARVMLRIIWFFGEMRKFNHICLIEDYEFDHNRNEDNPAFDDFALWDELEAKKLQLYPDGVFSEKSYEAVEAGYDVHLSQKIREYYETHPMEKAALIERSRKLGEDEKDGK
jgi:hypothetical protein